MLNLKKLRFNGRLATGRNGRNRVGFEIDSMFVAGRLPSDTLALKLDRFSVREHRRHIDLDASATTWLAMSSYGRMKVPVDISSEISFPKDSVFAIEVKDLKATVAAIPLEADAYVRYGDRLYVKGTAAINGCKVNDVINYFGKNLWKPAGDISTDAEISMSAAFDGFYDSSTGEIPDITAHIEIPDSWIGNKKVDIRHEIALDTDISGKSDGKLDVRLNDFHIRGKALQIIDRYSSIEELAAIPCNSETNKQLSAIAQSAGIKKHFTFHTARHTCATLLIHQGVPITTVQKLLGHTSVKTTQIYSEVIPNTLITDLKKAQKSKRKSKNKPTE